MASYYVFVAAVAAFLSSPLLTHAQIIVAENTTGDFAENVLIAGMCLSTMESFRVGGGDTFAAALEELGCYSLSFDPMWARTPSVVQSSPQSQTAIQNCAAFCQLSQGEGNMNQTQFAVTNTTCYCVSGATLISSQTPTVNQSCCAANSTCVGTNLNVWQLGLACSLQQSLCVGSCAMSNGCCLPSGSPSPQEPSLASQLLLLELIIILLACIALSVFAYRCILDGSPTRLTEMLSEEGHRRRFVLPGGDLSHAVVMMGPTGLSPTARRCANLFPSAADVSADTTCCFCLDPCTQSPTDSLETAIETPCKHIFHRKCIQDYIRHKLRTTLEDFTCPMCRSVIVCQLLDEDSPLSRLRETLFEMRNGRQRPSDRPSEQNPSVSRPQQNRPAARPPLTQQATVVITPPRRHHTERSADLVTGAPQTSQDEVELQEMNLSELAQGRSDARESDALDELLPSRSLPAQGEPISTLNPEQWGSL